MIILGIYLLKLNDSFGSGPRFSEAASRNPISSVSITVVDCFLWKVSWSSEIS